MNEDGTRRERDWNGTGGGRDGFDAEGGFTSRRGGVKTKWERKPVLWEWDVRDEVGGDGRGEAEKEGFEDVMVSLYYFIAYQLHGEAKKDEARGLV